MKQSNSRFAPGRAEAIHDSYPVHLINQIQPYGILVAITWPGLVIERISANAHQYLGLSSSQLLGQPLSQVMSADTIVQLEQAATSLFSTADNLKKDRQKSRPVYCPVSVIAGKEERVVSDGLLHSVQNGLVLELEPRRPELEHKNEIALSERDQNYLSQSINYLRSIKDINEFLDVAVSEMKGITGYDRVMIYQFDEKANGEVVAEAKQAEQVSYVGLHYPATDIPALVRSFYQSGMTRFVPDVSAEPVDIEIWEEQIFSQDGASQSEDCPEGRLLDLSAASLRGVDPCCVEYHQNMDVAAFLVLSIIKNGQLWGLVSCHHQTPKFLPYRIRSACEILSQFIAAELSTKVNAEEKAYLNQLQAIQSDFVTSITEAQDLKEALIHPAPRLLDLVTATGAAVCLDQDITLVGETPDLEAVESLVEWSLKEAEEDIFHTDCLPKIYLEAAAYKAVASGVLILRISQLRRYLILWFRPEVLQTVNWAGDPKAAVQVTEEDAVILCPRNSFELWQETVQETSLPWKPAELESATQLKSTIVGIVLNKADELAQINLELTRSNRELDSFAYAASHDLKEPLRGITNFANILLRRHSADLDETGIKRLNTLVRLTQRMDNLIDALLRFSRLGQMELCCQPTNINQLVEDVIEDLTTGREEMSSVVRITRSLPTIRCDPTLLREVFINLIDNAFKYSSDEPVPLIEVGYLTPDEYQPLNVEGNSESPIFYVKDNGIGIPQRHAQNIFRLFKRLHDRESYGGGNGVGLTITQKIIERHGGRIWMESTLGEWTVFYFDVEYCEM